MASPSGNPSPTTSAAFELSMLFNPPANPATGAIFPPMASAPPPGPYSYPPAAPPFHLNPYPPDAATTAALHIPAPAYASPNPTPNPVPGPNPGARLMQLLGTAAHLESTPPPSPTPTSSSGAPTPPPPHSGALARMASSGKIPRGRLLLGGPGDRAVHDVDSRLHPGEARPPQLEVTPITKYTSDPGLVLGRQIAVNRTYIVYGLKMGNIRVLNINTALRSLLRGHSQVRPLLLRAEGKF